MGTSCIVTEIKRDIGRNSQFLIPHLHSTPLSRGPRRNTAMSFGTEKLTFDDTFKRFEIINEHWRTDGRTPHGRAYACIVRQKLTGETVCVCFVY